MVFALEKTVWPATLLLLVLSVLYTLRRRPQQKSPAGGQKYPNTADISHIEQEREISIPFAMDEVRVSKILVHPVKSCRGTSLSESRYTPEGLENDRKWCIVDAGSLKIITAREVSKMVLITPSIAPDASSPYGGSLVVSFPDGSGCEAFSVPLNPSSAILDQWKILENFSVWGTPVDGYICECTDAPSLPSPSEILSRYFDKPVHLVMKGPRPRVCKPTLSVPDLKATTWFQDGFPLLIASEESAKQVEQTIQSAAKKGPEAQIGGMDYDRWRDGELKIERFRPNIVVKGSGVPFGEDTWREIVVSPDPTVDLASVSPEQTMTLVSKCTRCLLPNVDVTTGVRDAAVPFKVLMKFRTGKDPAQMNQSCFGCNAVYGGDGVVHVGDWIRVKTWAGEGGV